MKVDLYNIDYQEFLSIISGIKTIEEHKISINYEHEIIGTLEQLNELSKGIENIDLKRFIFDLNEKCNIVLSDIEIMNYLKKLTNNFELEFTKEALFELEVFENTVFDETIIRAVQEKYYNEGWAIPTYEIIDPITKNIRLVNDFKKMQSKVFPFIRMQLNFAKYYLQKNLIPQHNTKDDLNKIAEPNNLTNSTIEDWLFEFKDRNILTEPHYTNLVNALIYYFDNGVFPKLDTIIKVGRVNKKHLGWNLNRIFHSEGKGVEIDLLKFSKRYISTFNDVEFDEKDTINSNLYKYFTTKT